MIAPRRPTRRLVLGLAALACLGPACGAAPAGRFGRGFEKVPADREILAMERAMFERLNHDRAANGLPALAYDDDLAAIGRAHSADMRAHHFFAHESPTTGTLEDRLDIGGYLALAGRENLAEAADVSTAEDGLMQSPGHHANIMAKDVTRVGIGVVRGGVKDSDNYLFTQVFARPARPESASRTRDIVRERITSARQRSGAPALKRGGLFQALAEAHIADLADAVDDAATSRVSDAVMNDLSRRAVELPAGRSLGVVVEGAMILDPSMYEVPDAVLAPEASEIGVATKDGRDARGRPAMKVLVLVAE
jgi:uncharacterized protein YkwD